MSGLIVIVCEHGTVHGCKYGSIKLWVRKGTPDDGVGAPKRGWIQWQGSCNSNGHNHS
jgi:hypothetical protein